MRQSPPSRRGSSGAPRVSDELDAYAAGLTARVHSTGAEVESTLTYGQDGGSAQLELIGHLPGGASLVVKERWLRTFHDRQWEPSGYIYELLDVERGFRRGWHMHNPNWFARRHRVIVHEHCEQPIGTVACDHYAGVPVPNGWAGVDLAMKAWLVEFEGCAGLVCLEPA